jgi:two-component system, OmpR family, alkaline phosphatase synthesis response regulator PhoP
MAKILVADDEPDIQTFLILALEHVGHEVLSAEDGEEAIGLALRETPDLILMDVRMPVMDGYEACRRIRAIPSLQHVPVVLLSVRGADAVQRGLDAGATEYVVKPFALEKLLERVSEILARTGTPM